MKISGLNSLRFRFSLIVGIILFLFCLFFSSVLYYYLRTHAIENANRKTLIIMTYVKAIGDYVKNSFRPGMLEVLSRQHTEDEFLVEAMSTTHVNLEVMRLFNKDLSEYIYKRVSDKPLNSEQKADVFQLKMMRYFENNRMTKSWHGIVKIKGRETLVYTRPVISDRTCLTCHGSRDTAPASLVKRYGESGNFGWSANKVVGVESVSIPLDLAFARIRRITIETFIFGFSTLGLLFFAIYGTFSHLVTKPLNNLSNIFKGITNGTQPLGRDIPADRNDEIGELTESFNILSRHLLEAQEKLKKTADLEKQMMETEKLATLGQLSAGVAHEINNPIGGIRLCFNNLINTDMDTATMKQHAEVVNSGLDRIQRIVKQLLDFSKNAPLDLLPASVNKIIENVLNISRYTISKKGITLIKDLSHKVPELMVDPNKLEQVFLNLIINAVQAMDGEGILTIRTWRDDSIYSVSFSDTGGGIPEEVLPNIFDPFFTTKDVGEGTGLGLTVSKAIVEQHGGEIVVETSGSGTTFTVRLSL